MKVLFDARTTGPDGIGRYVRNLAQSLNEKLKKTSGNTFELISRDFNLQDICDLCNIDDSPHYSLAEITNKSLLISKRKPNLMHCTDYRVPLEGGGTPIVVTIHDIFRYTDPTLCYDDETFKNKYGLQVFEEMKQVGAILGQKLSEQNLKDLNRTSSLHFIYYSRMLRWAINSASAIITPTEVVKNEIIQNFGLPDKIYVVPYGIDHIDKKTEIVKSQTFLSLPSKYILYVGQYRSHKNVDQLIMAFKNVEKLVDDLHLVLIGPDFIDNSKLDKFLESLNISKKVNRLGSLSYENLRTVYARSKALVHLSKLEGFGLTPLEALSCGATVIAAENPTLKEILNDFATYVDPMNIKEVSNAITTAIEAEVAEVEKDKRVKYSGTFTWSKAAEKTIGVYNNALSYPPK